MRVESTGSSLSTSASPTERVQQQQQQSVQKEAAQKPQESQPAARSTDRLNISRLSEQLQKATTASQDSTVRAEKSDQVKQALQSNQYQVNSRDVAEKFLYLFNRGPTA